MVNSQWLIATLLIILYSQSYFVLHISCLFRGSHRSFFIQLQFGLYITTTARKPGANLHRGFHYNPAADGLLNFIQQLIHQHPKNNCIKICATKRLHIYLQPNSCATKKDNYMRRDIFQAIADPTRRAIIALIALQSMKPNAIADNFHSTRQSVSKHLRILTECELVKQEQQGREIYYSLEIKKLKEVDKWLNQFRKLWETRFNQLDNVLSTMKKQKK